MKLVTLEALANLLASLPPDDRMNLAHVLERASTANGYAYGFTLLTPSQRPVVVEATKPPPSCTWQRIDAEAWAVRRLNVEEAYAALDELETFTRAEGKDFLDVSDRRELQALRVTLAAHTKTTPLFRDEHLAAIAAAVDKDGRWVALPALATLSKANFECVERRHPTRILGLGRFSEDEISAAIEFTVPHVPHARQLLEGLASALGDPDDDPADELWANVELLRTQLEWADPDATPLG
ncbi:hypothetical protein LZC95_19760 [Pendulispora brunnea]|uniref:Uncharacterized protein n=1 Tax=Pendulispora brunnea TaxID=2905690 RepID=A0ABZ2KK55_9BACT